jgi:hypothetical protein
MFDRSTRMKVSSDYGAAVRVDPLTAAFASGVQRLQLNAEPCQP